MGIFDTPEKDSYNVEGTSDTIKLYTSLVKSYSTLFSFSVGVMYKRAHRSLKNALC